MTEKEKRKIGKYLNKLISDALWGGNGEAGGDGLNASAIAYIVLGMLKLPVKNSKQVELELRGENVYSFDFIDFFEKDT